MIYCKKVSFGTKQYADAYITKLQKTSQREKVPVASYLCTKCNCWHLTSWQQPDIDKLIKEFNQSNEKRTKAISEARAIVSDTIMVLSNLKMQQFNIQAKIEKIETQLQELKKQLKKLYQFKI